MIGIRIKKPVFIESKIFENRFFINRLAAQDGQPVPHGIWCFAAN